MSTPRYWRETLTPLRSAGLSYADISAKIGMSRSRVGELCKQLKIPGPTKEPADVCPHCGNVIHIRIS